MDERSRRVQRRLEVPLLVAALLVVPTIVLEESSVGVGLKTFGDVLNWSIWFAFVAEIVIMLRVVPERRRWLRDHPLDLAIVVLTPPFLPAALQSARIFRLLRLLRLVRFVQLTRRMFSLEGVRDAGVLALFTIIGGGVAFAAIEDGHHDTAVSGWDGVWWAVTTVTTVGYGDLYPATSAGRMIAMAVMVVGIGFIALLTAAAAQRFITPSVREVQDELAEEEADLLGEIREISRRLQRLEERVTRRTPGPPAAG